MTDANEGFVPILNKVLPLYPALLATGNTPPMKLGYRKVPHLAHGWFMRVQRGVEAILALDSLGYAEEAVGISRSVIEHIVALQWLRVEGDKIVDTVALGHKSGAEKLLKATKDAQWTTINLDKIESAIESVEADRRDPTNNVLLQFYERNKRYGDVGTLPLYYASVARVHPTYESAMCYVDQVPQRVRTESKDSMWQVPFCTGRLMEAILVVRDVFEPEPWKDELTELLAQYKIAVNAVRAENGQLPIPDV
ncbi:DUF5677 domain-containing protein [Jatrophihabitans sp. DSM 45814]